jgi:hypothetical protein
MRLVKIKNKYLYKGDNPEGSHTYAVYYDRASKRNRAVGLTHLYVKDNKRFTQIKNGLITVEKFKEFETPSGVKNSYFDKNLKGGKIDLKDSENVKVYKRYLPAKQADRIKKFAKRRNK